MLHLFPAFLLLCRNFHRYGQGDIFFASNLYALCACSAVASCLMFSISKACSKFILFAPAVIILQRRRIVNGVL